MTQDFAGFPKIARLSRDCVITEKIDGTNAQICIAPVPKPAEGSPDWPSPDQPMRIHYWYGPDASMWGMWAGSRTRWIVPGDDNFGFAAWVYERRQELVDSLGPGNHFGEWWGRGIQRGYGLAERRFSLFNVGRWNASNVPECCGVVPILYQGPFDTQAVEEAITALSAYGSSAAPGFKNPEGVIIYHTASKTYFKKTLHKDNEPKGSA